MHEITVQRLRNLVLYKVWFLDVPGYSVVKMRKLKDANWWFELVRVGSPAHRGAGLGSQLLELAITYARDELNATNIGLEPRALGYNPGFDLTSWYQRHGFVHVKGEELWLFPLKDEGASEEAPSS